MAKPTSSTAPDRVGKSTSIDAFCGFPLVSFKSHSFYWSSPWCCLLDLLFQEKHFHRSANVCTKQKSSSQENMWKQWYVLAKTSATFRRMRILSRECGKGSCKSVFPNQKVHVSQIKSASLLHALFPITDLELIECEGGFQHHTSCFH